MADTDALLSDHEWKLKMAAEGKVIYVPGKTAEHIKAEMAAQAKQLARKSARTITLAAENWRGLDTAIPDIIETLADARNLFSGLACMDDPDRDMVHSMKRLAARAIESTEEKEVRLLERLDSTVREGAAREAEERRQAELVREQK